MSFIPLRPTLPEEKKDVVDVFHENPQQSIPPSLTKQIFVPPPEASMQLESVQAPPSTANQRRLAHAQARLRSNPNDALAHATLGGVLQEGGAGVERNRTQAGWHLEQALRLDPNSAFTHMCLGKFHRYGDGKQKNLPQAKWHFEEAVRLDPSSAIAHNCLGIMLRLGEGCVTRNTKQAKWHLEEAIRISPSNGFSHHNLGLLLMEGGDGVAKDLEKAKWHFEQILTVSPIYKAAQTAIKEIAKELQIENASQSLPPAAPTAPQVKQPETPPTTTFSHLKHVINNRPLFQSCQALYKKLAIELKKAWLEHNPTNRLLVNQLIRRHGDLFCNFAELPRDPFDIICRRKPDLDALISIVLDIKEFWCPGSLETFSLSTDARRIVDVMLASPRESNTSRMKELQSQYGALSLDAALQVSQTFIEHKFAEFLMRVEHLKEFLSKPDEPARVMPFFVVAQDASKVHLDIQNVYYDGKTFIGMLGDKTNAAEKYLQQVFHNQCKIVTTDTQKSCTLTIKQWEKLCKLLENRDQLPFLMLKRITPAPIEPQTPSVTPTAPAADHPPAKTKNPASEMQESVIRAEGGIEDTRREIKNKRPLAESAPEEVRAASGAATVKRLKTAPKYKPENVYHPLTMTTISHTCAPGQNLPKQVGQIPVMTASPIQSVNLDPVLKDPTKLWSFWMQRDIQTVAKDVAAEDAKRRVLLDKSALVYPIAAKLEALPEPKEVACLISLLKDYQRQAVNRGMLFQKEGIGFLLCLEMGLGKTLTALEEIFQQMATHKTGKHLIITPNSVLDTTLDEYKKGLREAKFTAFRIWLARNPDQKATLKRVEVFLKRLDQLLREFNPKKQHELECALRLLPFIPNEYLHDTFYSRLDGKQVTKPLHALFEQHLKNLFTNYFEIDEKKSKIQAAIQDLKRKAESLKLSPDKLKLLRVFLDNFCEDGTIFGFDKVFANSDPKALIALTSELLAIDLERTLDAPEKYLLDLKGIETILDFEESQILATSTPHEVMHALKQESGICITTIEALQKVDPTKFATQKFLTLICDEAQKLKSEKVNAHELLIRWIAAIQESGQRHGLNPAIIFPTGTPFSNECKDFWNLLSVMNPGLFLESTYNAMDKGLVRVTQLLHEKYSPELEKSLLASFTYYYYLQHKIVQSLVFHARKEDPSVCKTWDGRVPTRKDMSAACHNLLSVKSRENLERLYKQYQNDGKIFSYEKALQRALLHSSLCQEGISLDRNNASPEVEILLGVLHSENEVAIQALIHESPLLMALVGTKALDQEQVSLQALERTEEIEEAIKKHQEKVTLIKLVEQATNANEPMVILIDNIKSAEIIQAALKYKFGDKIDPRLFDGSLNRDQKTKLVDWFNGKNNSSTPVMLLSVKSGGVGLNLPKGKYVIDLTKLWVPADRDQAVARAIRAGNQGEKVVVTPRFGTHFEDHLQRINKEKTSWTQFLWPDKTKVSNADLQWFFRQFLNILKQMIAHKQMNNNKAKALAKEEMQKIVLPNLHKLKDTIKLSKLIETCKQVMNLELEMELSEDDFEDALNDALGDIVSGEVVGLGG